MRLVLIPALSIYQRALDKSHIVKTMLCSKGAYLVFYLLSPGEAIETLQAVFVTGSS